MSMVLLTSGAVLVLTCGFYLAFELLTSRRTLVVQLTTLGRVIGSNSTAALAFNNAEDAEQILSALAAEPHIAAAGLFTTDGRLLAKYPAQLDATSLPRPVAPLPSAPQFSRDGLSAFQPVQQDGKTLGTLYLRSDLGALWARLRLFSGMVLVLVAAACTLAYFVSERLQQQISQPILALESTARAVSDRRDYSVRATKQGDDEVGRLTDAFNHMLGQIEQLNRELEARVLARTSELQAANRELEAFSYSVSHDLRAPLRHIGGFAAMLDRHAMASLDEKGRRYLTVIQDSTRRMGQLIDDLLQFSRHGRAELRREPVKLDELVAEVRQGLQGESAGRTITWEVEPLPVVAGDTALLRQVITNLLGNAVKYTRRQPEARIHVGTERGTGDEAIVFVRDNGAGFDMQYADKLFGVFQRLHRDDEFEGTGIGLATVRRIVQRHGGRVWAKSAIAAGATFYIALPMASATAPASNDPVPAMSSTL